MTDFPRPPASLDGKCSDLLKRVENFLPQIQRANEDLDASEAQLDATLVEDKGEEDSCESRDEESDQEEESPEAPMIELKVDVGKLDENPEIALLADGNDKVKNGDEEIEAESTKEHEDNSESAKALSNMMKQDKKPVAKKRKVLMEELS